MPEKFPPLPPVRARGAAASHEGARRSVDEQVARFLNDDTTGFVILVKGMAQARSGKAAADVIADHAFRMYRERSASMLDDLAELWWKSEHEGARVRPFSSLPVGERADLRGRVKRLIVERIPDSLGDQAVLEGEPKRLLEMPLTALRRANADLERRVERDRTAWLGVGGPTMHAIFAAGQVAIAHLGDCRALRLRRGILDTLTHEHTVQRVYEETGNPMPDHLAPSTLGRWLGGAWGPGPDVVISTAQSRDLFIFMTRGFYDHFSPAIVKDALSKHGTEAAPRLVAEGQAAAPENVAAVAVEIL